MVFAKATHPSERRQRRLWPQGRSIGQSVDMPPKKTSGLTASKKRPHEAPVKGRKSFAGSRQKVAKGGGGGGDRDDDAGGDDMLEDALDEDEFGRKKGKKGGDSDEDSDEEVKETADEKRLRLAKSYLEKLRREEAEDGSGSDEDEDEDNIRNMDSHDRLANRLKNEAMAKSGRVRREIAHRVVAPTLDDDSDVDEDDETETEGDAWRDVRRGHKLSVTGMSLTPDDSTCYTVSKDGSIARWDIETGARTRFPRGPPAVVDPTRGGGGPMAPPKCGAATLLCCADEVGLPPPPPFADATIGAGMVFKVDWRSRSFFFFSAFLEPALAVGDGDPGEFGTGMTFPGEIPGECGVGTAACGAETFKSPSATV